MRAPILPRRVPKTGTVDYPARVETEKKPRFGLLPRIVVAVALGIICGQFFPEPLTRVFVTFNGLFSNALGFLIPLLIVGLITPAISELGRGAGRLLAITAAIAYLSTLLGGFMGYGAGLLTLPPLLENAPTEALTNPEEVALEPYFSIEMPPLMEVMTALLLAFVIGVTLTFMNSTVIHQGFVEFREIITTVIWAVIIPLLPVYIFGIFLNMAATGQAWVVISTFLGVIILVFILTAVLLLIQYSVASLVAGGNPLSKLKTMLPAYFTALGTSSSAATIPVTLRQTVEMGVARPIASFVIPLGATIHLGGSMVKIVSFSLAIAMLFGMQIPTGLFIGFIFMLGIIMIAAPGVPGGAIMTAAGLLTSMLGFNEVQVGLMIATYIAIDSFGTATNVTGDGAIARIIDRIAQRDPRLAPADTGSGPDGSPDLDDVGSR